MINKTEQAMSGFCIIYREKNSENNANCSWETDGCTGRLSAT